MGKKKYMIYNILIHFCSKYTIYIYFENLGKYAIDSCLKRYIQYTFRIYIKKLLIIAVMIYPHVLTILSINISASGMKGGYFKRKVVSSKLPLDLFPLFRKRNKGKVHYIHCFCTIYNVRRKNVY